VLVDGSAVYVLGNRISQAAAYDPQFSYLPITG
jgi:hypothetical protein